MILIRKYKYIHLVILLIHLIGCSNSPIIEEYKNSEDIEHTAFLTFTFRDVFTYSNTTTRTLISGSIEHDKEEGKEYENKIHNVHILLFNKNGNDLNNASLSVMRFYDIKTGILERNNGYYHTPVELVKPGKYVIYMCINSERDLFSNLKIKEGDTFFNFMNKLSKVPTDSQLDNNLSQIKEKGLFADYYNTDFIVPSHYTSSNNPYISQITFTRLLSKLRVSITNINDEGKIYQNSSKFYLESFSTYRAQNYYLFNNLLREDISNNLKNKIKYNTITLTSEHNSGITNKSTAFNSPIPKTIISETYLPPSFDRDIYRDAFHEYSDITYLSVVAVNKESGLKKQYNIPIYDTIKGSKNYSIISNTLYEINIFFKGPEIIAKDIYYNQIGWTEKSIEIPNFE